MKTQIYFAPVLLLLLLIHTAVFAQSSGNAFPRLDPDPKALELYRLGTGGRTYSWTDLAEAGLWASGADGSRLEQIRALAGAIQSDPDFPGSAEKEAEFILDYLYKNLLKTYSTQQTRVDTMLASGSYNCVSSAVLYLILCKSVDLDAQGVMTKDHAFVTVLIDGENIDVETTNPYGFDPGSRKDFHDQFGKLTGFAYVPARNYRDREAISPMELISLILSNRISELERANRFAEAVPLAVDRMALLAGDEARGADAAPTDQTAAADGGPTASFFEDPRKDLVDRLLNYGAFLLKAGREEDGLRWAALAAAQYPDEKRWQEFILAAVNNRIAALVAAGRIAEARNFLSVQEAALVPANYAQMDAKLIDAELLDSVNKIRDAAGGDKVIASIDAARSGGRIDAKRASALLSFAVQKTAAILSAAPGRDWLAAINYIESAVTRYGSTPEIEQALRTYRSNLATDFHNRFAAAWNKKNYDDALQILNDGLAEFPSDRQLLADRDVANRNRPVQ